MSSLNDDAQLLPELSYVVVTDTYATIRGVVDRIRRQTIRDRIEVVLVALRMRWKRHMCSQIWLN